VTHCFETVLSARYIQILVIVAITPTGDKIWEVLRGHTQKVYISCTNKAKRAEVEKGSGSSAYEPGLVGPKRRAHVSIVRRWYLSLNGVAKGKQVNIPALR